MRVFGCWFSVLLSMTAASSVSAADIRDLFKNADQRAVELLENGEAEAASDLFKNSQWQGVSQYRAGSYEDAMQSFGLSDDATAHYNVGTAAAQAGDYNQAVKSLETALSLAPDDKRIAENLDIARKLKDLAEQGEQAQNESDNPEDQQQEGEESQEQQEQSGEQSDQQSGDQSSDESQSEGEDSAEQAGDEQNGEPQSEQGELNADEAEQQNDNPSDPELEELRQQLQQQQAESDTQETVNQAVADSSVSEDDQATEQWLRRIPDDASQLLRNKIRLNHLIEYPDVRDMEESW